MNQVPANWPAQAQRIFDEVRELTFDGVGITRESYGPGENATIDYLKALAERAGLIVSFDRAANLIIDMPGSGNAPALWCGSHLDSVPQGGNFDGLAGVVAGLLCMTRLKEEGVHLSRPFRLIGIRGEESAWFGKAYMGSGALFGKLLPEDLALRSHRTGQTLAECMTAVGADVGSIQQGASLIDGQSIAGYIELHIEQGPVMVERQWSTAIVSGIRGNVRHNRIRCVGEAGHSGAVPRNIRHDAAFAVAYLITRLDQHWQALLEQGKDLVVTFGVVGTNPQEHAVSRIPGEVDFSFEVRSECKLMLEQFYQLMRDECTAITKERGVEFVFDRRVLTHPALMDGSIVERLLAISKRLGLPSEKIASGAGHDASVFANAGIPSAMIFIRNEHGSHNPREAMESDDFIAGTNLLYHAIMELQPPAK
ncbi:MAG: beta-ureidopropionase / N-carbamoyl-L-amino-acid hydrolase [Burkholderiales bacterium]|jgi:N-carbamoyl-L-amino-acid hydrolase